MADERSKYASNQFETVTVGRNPLMSEILVDTEPRIIASAAAHPELVSVKNEFLSIAAAWDAGETVLTNAEAALPSKTLALDDKLASISRKPDLDTNSPIETWDTTIRSQVAYQGTIYTYILPNGRETITGGGKDQQIDALRDVGIRLSEQAGKPVLIALGVTITAFYTATIALRDAQNTAKATLDAARVEQEALRKMAAAVLYKMVGFGITVFSTEPEMVDTLFDVNLLRSNEQVIPEPPADTAWTPGTRTLTTTAMPDGATRLEAWREGPGGVPELLAIGERGALSVMIPAYITFDVGDLYQLWLQARNSRGSSTPGPKQSWTAT
jgi:hypothetical protein